jgi:hypothetical protein
MDKAGSVNYGNKSDLVRKKCKFLENSIDFLKNMC